MRTSGHFHNRKHISKIVKNIDLTATAGDIVTLLDPAEGDKYVLSEIIIETRERTAVTTSAILKFKVGSTDITSTTTMDTTNGAVDVIVKPTITAHKKITASNPLKLTTTTAAVGTSSKINITIVLIKIQ